MKLWITLCIVGGGLLVCRPTFASGSLLYIPDAKQSLIHVGQAVQGIANVRRITAAQQSALSARELATVQPERTYHAMFSPNDPQFPYQWNLPAMNVPTAWENDTTPPVYGGDGSVIVAVLDSGIASTLVGSAASVPDINTSTIWTNTAEVPNDGIDNDHDGFIDDVHGWNFVNGTNQPADDNKHGTHISSIIASAMNNGLAIAGIASNVTIMPLKVLQSDGSGSTTALTAAVQYAVTHGASIINLSLGGTEDDPIFHQAIQTAVTQGIVVVAAAGNEGASSVTYPARYSEVLSVGATQFDATRAAYANYGSTLDIVAPGGNTAVDQNGDGQPDGILAQTCTSGVCNTFTLEYISGTSQAAAEVSAVAALVRSCGVPGGAIKHLLTSTARDIGVAGRDDQFGSGLVDAAAAMTSAGCPSTGPATPTQLTVQAGTKAHQQLISGRAYSYTSPVLSWVNPTGTTSQLTVSLGTTTLAQQTIAASSYTVTVKKEGVYTLTIVALDMFGRASLPVTFRYRYQLPVTIVGSTEGVQFLSDKLAVTKRVSFTTAKEVTASGGVLVPGQAGRLLVGTSVKGSEVTMTDTKGKKIVTVQPFGKNFTGTISSAIEQLADGSSLVVMATAQKGSSVAWVTTDGVILGRIQVIPNDIHGLSLTTGDVNGDGNDEVIVGQNVGAQVLVYDVNRTKIGKFMPRGKAFRQGWVVAAGDRDGDGRSEILLTPNVPQSPPKIIIIDAKGVEKKAFTLSGYPKNTLLTIQGSDVTGDGIAELTVANRNSTNSTIQRWTLQGKALQSANFTKSSIHSLSSWR